MIDSPSYSETGSASGDNTHTLFGQTMGYVAVTAGFFALGAHAGRLGHIAEPSTPTSLTAQRAEGR